MPSLRIPSGENFVFDGIIEESHENTATVTDHPIEGRVAASDHRQKAPFRLTVEAIVTATPFVGPNDPANPVVGSSPAALNFRLRRALSFFERNEDEIFSYSSVRLGTFEDLALESYNYTIDNENRIVFELQFKQVTFARSEIVELPPLRRRTLEPTVDEGDQACPVVGTPESEQVEGEFIPDNIVKQSWLQGLANRFTGGN